MDEIMREFIESPNYTKVLSHLFGSVRVADVCLDPFLRRIASCVEDYSLNGCFVEAAFWAGRVFLVVGFSVGAESVFLEVLNLQISH